MVYLSYKIKTVDGQKNYKKISKSIALILEEAEKRGVKWENLENTNLFRLEYGGVNKYLYGQIPFATTALAYCACKDKRITRSLLENAGIKVVDGFLIRFSDSTDYKLKVFDDLNKPLVVKPVNQMQGKNVLLNIKTRKEYLNALEKIYSFYGKKEVNLLVEEMFFAPEYRILATKEKVLSIIKRVPPNVVGNGVLSIRELIALKNQDPIRLEMTTYSKISTGKAVQSFLRQQGLSLESIPPKGKQIILLAQTSANISYGGDTVDVTDQVHQSVKKIALKVVKSIPGLALAGIDYMSKDIQGEQRDDSYRIIEVNASPSLDWNQYPLQGPKRDIAYEFLKIMFPDLA